LRFLTERGKNVGKCAGRGLEGRGKVVVYLARSVVEWYQTTLEVPVCE
jgi:hypothetical protein